MRLLLYTLTIVCAATFEQCTAAPSFRQGHTRGHVYDSEDIEFRTEENMEALKYFHEPGDNEIFSHYDRRYFHGVVTDEVRTDSQSHMIRAYLDFFRSKDLDTWIAHGTLLGWWWNGKRLPWDVDLDTQVSEATLNRLGKEYNQTKYEYTSPDGKTRRQYLLDVNPMIWERVRGDGMNVIDARWIDVRNGLFIDITGLSVTNPVSYPGVWSCKNNHMYKTIELYPMRETTFEGTLAKVPYAYDQILTDEYRASALVNTNFNGHNWDPKRKEWVKSSEFLKGEQENKRREESDNEKSQLERMRLA